MRKDLSDKVQALIEEINKGAEWAEEYAKSDESMHAEFCQSFANGEDGPQLDRLEPEVRTRAELLMSLAGKRDALDEVIEVCNLECVVGIFTMENEVYSVLIGEIEEQLPEELSARLKALTAEEFEQVQRYIDGYVPDNREYLYVNCDYDRFVMVLDLDRLEARIEELQADAEVES